MIVAVLSALAMVFYVGALLMGTGYTAWAANAHRFGKVMMAAGALCWIAGIVLGIRIIAALLGWI